MSGGLFTEEERDELRRTLAEEMRVIGLLDVPQDVRPPYPVDDVAERQLIAMAREGQVARVSPKEFGRAFYGTVFLIIGTCWSQRKEPTTNRVCWLLRQDGWPVRVEVDVRTLLDNVPVQMSPSVAVRRVREAARRRAMLDHIVELDALLRSVDSTNETISNVLQKLIGVARGK